MVKLSRKSRFKQLLYSPLSIGLLLIPIVLLGNAAWNARQTALNTEANLAAVSSELTDLQVREEALTTELDRLDTERGMEEEIRRKFELGKEGEELVIIVEDKNKTEPEPQPEQKPWWKWWGD